MQQGIGIGCMRLSTVEERDDDDGVAMLRIALEAGVDWFDTADAYCLDEDDVGHNERLLARAVGAWSGDPSRITIATKGGLTRPGGRWVPDGRARHLRAACERSLNNLGVATIDLYQLHAPDPRVPFERSVRALDKLKREGLVRAIGLCNVSARQIEAALAITEIEVVQVEFGPLATAILRDGVASTCTKHDLRLIAHSPLGGPRRVGRLGKDPELAAIAAVHGRTAWEVALAWTRSAVAGALPIPGATRVETVRSIRAAADLQLSPEERARLDARFAADRIDTTPARAQPETDGRIVLVMGMPAAGKTTHVAPLVESGHVRLNRDEFGGRIADLRKPLEAAIARGERAFVLDNTFATRRSRSTFVEIARRHGMAIDCVWLKTSLADAQINAVTRLLSRFGHLPDPAELRSLARQEAGVFAPNAQFRFERELEPPEQDEGFASIEVLPFERHTRARTHDRGVLLSYPRILWHNAPDDAGAIDIRVERGAKLRELAKRGWRILGISWQPCVADGQLTAAEVERRFAATNRELGVQIEPLYCPHPAGPPICWCRTPLPGLAVRHLREHGLDPAACTLVGTSTADRTLAARMGFAHVTDEQFFASIGPC